MSLSVLADDNCRSSPFSIRFVHESSQLDRDYMTTGGKRRVYKAVFEYGIGIMREGGTGGGTSHIYQASSLETSAWSCFSFR